MTFPSDDDVDRELCGTWKQWVAGPVKKYEWDIDPDNADHPTIHGPRGIGILARAEVGYDVDQQIMLEFGRLPFHHSPTDSDDRKRLEAAVWNRLAETSSRRRVGRQISSLVKAT